MDFDGFDYPLSKEDIEVLTAYQITEEYESQREIQEEENKAISKNSSCCGVFLVFALILAISLLV